MTQDTRTAIAGEPLGDDIELDVTQLCRICRTSTATIEAFVSEGIIDPIGTESARWRFEATAVRRVRCAMRLTRDLGVNYAGAALALDLLDELDLLRARLTPDPRR